MRKQIYEGIEVNEAREIVFKYRIARFLLPYKDAGFMEYDSEIGTILDKIITKNHVLKIETKETSFTIFVTSSDGKETIFQDANYDKLIDVLVNICGLPTLEEITNEDVLLYYLSLVI